MSNLSRLPSPSPRAQYTLERVAELSGLTRREVLVCLRYGLVRPQPLSPFGMMGFDEVALHTLRQISRIRIELDVNFTAARVIVALWQELERVRRARDVWRVP